MPAPGTYLVRADEVKDFLSGRAAAVGGSARGSISLLGERPNPTVLKRLARSVGFYRGLLRRPVGDVWSRGWEADLDDETWKKKAAAFDASIRVHPTLRHVKAGFKRAHLLARRDGKALLYIRLKDGAGNAALPPTNVRAVLEVRAIPKDRIVGVIPDDDIESDRYGQPKAYKIRARKDDATSEVVVHWQRAILFIEQPDEEAGDFEGESELEAHLGNAHGRENIRAIATKGYYERVVPLLVAKIDAEAPFGPEDEKKLDEQLDKLDSGATNRIRIQGGELVPLTGSENVNDPTPFIDMHETDASAGSGVPIGVIKGDPAGTLAAAQWEMRRYFESLIVPLQEEFAAAVVLAWYSLNMEWGLLPQAEIRGIRFFPPASDEKDTALRLFHLGNAANAFARVKAPMPKEMQAQLTFKPGSFDPDKPMELVAGGFGGGFGGNPEGGAPPAREGDAARRAARDEGIEVDPELDAIADRFEHAVRRALVAWRRAVEAVVGDKIEGTAGVKGDARTPEDVERRLLAITFEEGELAATMDRLLKESAQRGAYKTWRKLGKDGVLEFVDTPRAPVLVQYARAYSQRKAEAASRAVRAAVAGALLDGGGVAEVRAALATTFGRLENEATIARTEAMRGFNNGAKAALGESGFRSFRFVAYGGADDECQARHGQMFGLDDEENTPPVHPNCRCGVTSGELA